MKIHPYIMESCDCSQGYRYAALNPVNCSCGSVGVGYSTSDPVAKCTDVCSDDPGASCGGLNEYVQQDGTVVHYYSYTFIDTGGGEIHTDDFQNNFFHI